MMLSWIRHFVVAHCRRVSFLETPAGLCVESSRFKYALPQVLRAPPGTRWCFQMRKWLAYVLWSVPRHNPVSRHLHGFAAICANISAIDIVGLRANFGIAAKSVSEVVRNSDDRVIHPPQYMVFGNCQHQLRICESSGSLQTDAGSSTTALRQLSDRFPPRTTTDIPAFR